MVSWLIIPWDEKYFFPPKRCLSEVVLYLCSAPVCYSWQHDSKNVNNFYSSELFTGGDWLLIVFTLEYESNLNKATPKTFCISSRSCRTWLVCSLLMDCHQRRLVGGTVYVCLVS